MLILQDSLGNTWIMFRKMMLNCSFSFHVCWFKEHSAFTLIFPFQKIKSVAFVVLELELTLPCAWFTFSNWLKLSYCLEYWYGYLFTSHQNGLKFFLPFIFYHHISFKIKERCSINFGKSLSMKVFQTSLVMAANK